MKDKDPDSSPSPRYLSPAIKQDLASLDRDSESRRTAMNSLKSTVENLDPGSMPRFLAQVAEIRDQGQSKYKAIALYEDVARVHGKLIVPHIPRVMVTITKSLTSSGSTPQLHQACAKVVGSIAKFSIDEQDTRSQAGEVLREISEPLLELLVGKIEPLATGAAVCLQAIVESGKWENASDELVNELFLKLAVAMQDKCTRTVPHMQLLASLVSANAACIGMYGVSLLRAAVEVLRSESSVTWQQKSHAARLLAAILTNLDAASISAELSTTIQVLETSKVDRMPHVRSAASDALKIAKGLSSYDFSRRSRDGMDPLGIPPLHFLSDHDKYSKKASRRKSLFSVSETYMFYSAPRRASCCAPLCYSPPLSCESSASSFGSPSNRRLRRTPLFPARNPRKASLQTSSVSSSEVLDTYLHPDVSREANAKENVPARLMDFNAHLPWEIGQISGVYPRSGRVGKYVRPRPPTPGSHIPYPPSLSDKLGTEHQSEDIDMSPILVAIGRQGRNFHRMEECVFPSTREQDGVSLTQDEEVFSHGRVTPDDDIESDKSSSRESLVSVSSRSQSELSASYKTKASRESIGSYQPSSPARNGPALSVPYTHTSMKNVFDLKGPVGSMGTKGQDQQHQDISADEEEICPSDDFPGNDRNETDRACRVRARYNSLAHLANVEDSLSPKETPTLITAEDFRPYSTPRRLVRSLQSKVSSPESTVESLSYHQELRASGEVVDMTDMDLETSSEAGWSVRDNPIASDESFKTDSDEEDGRKIYKKMTGELKNEGVVATLMSRACTDKIAKVFIKTAGRSLSEQTAEKAADGRVTKPEEEVEVIKRTQQDDIASTFSTSLGGLRSLLTDDDRFNDCSCVGRGDELQHCEGGCKNVDADVVCQRGTVSGKFDAVVGSKAGCILNNTWRRARVCAEMCLGGSLLVVLALPLAMAMTKVIFRPEYSGLVPT